MGSQSILRVVWDSWVTYLAYGTDSSVPPSLVAISEYNDDPSDEETTTTETTTTTTTATTTTTLTLGGYKRLASLKTLQGLTEPESQESEVDQEGE